MFFNSFPLFLRPRHIMFSPPPLSKRTGKFRCSLCHSTWTSSQTWVTKTTAKAYQGESCERCGTTAKPFYIGRSQPTIFNRATFPRTIEQSRKKRYDWRISKGRR